MSRASEQTTSLKPDPSERSDLCVGCLAPSRPMTLRQAASAWACPSGKIAVAGSTWARSSRPNVPPMMCRTACFRHLGPHVSCGNRRSDPRRSRQEPCVIGICHPHANHDAKHHLAPVPVLREHGSGCRNVRLQSDAIRCGDVLRMRSHRPASERHRSAGTRRVFMESTVRRGIEH